MANIITNLHPETNQTDILYPNIVKDNIPSGSITKEKILNKSVDLSKLDDDVIELINEKARPTQDQVNEWLDNHPEATTSVLDHSLTYIKLVNGTLGFTTPSMYGAVADSVTNDATPIINALNNSKLVNLEGKTYYINDEIVLNEYNIIFNGNLVCGPNGHLKLNNNTIVKNINFTDSYDQNVMSGYCLYGVEIENVSVLNCTFIDIHKNYCIYFSQCQYGEILNNIIKNYNLSGIMLCDGCYDFIVNHNYVYNGTGELYGYRYPICLCTYSNQSRDNARRIICNYNYIEDLVPYWEGIDSHSLIDGEIAYNTIKNVARGIVLTSPTSAPIKYTENINIHDNIIVTSDDVTSLPNTNRVGIGIVAYGSKNIKILNNNIKMGYCRNADEDSAIRIASYSNDYVIENYLIENNVIYSTHNGIYITNVMKNITINNNVLDGTIDPDWYCIFLRQSNGYKGLSVTNNKIGFNYATNRAISGPRQNSLNSKDLVKLKGNIFGDVTSPIRENAYLDTSRTSGAISSIICGEIGDFILNSDPSNNIIGWYAVTDSDPSNNIKCTWKALVIE